MQITCRRLLELTAALAAACAVGLAGLHGARARADDRVPLGGGAGIIVNGDALCTLTTIGTDGKGELIGFTSAHCGGPGAPVVVESAKDRGPLGWSYPDPTPALVSGALTERFASRRSIARSNGRSARVARRNPR